MDPTTKNSITATPAKTHQSNRSQIVAAPKHENQNPNFRKPSLKSSKLSTTNEPQKDENQNPSLKSSKSAIISEPRKDENQNPNSKSPSLNSSKSRIISGPAKDENQNLSLKSSKSPVTSESLKSPPMKSATKTQKSAVKNPNPVFSPKNRIRERKFVIVTKKNLKRERANSAKAVCTCKERVGNKCLCLAYEILRASQEEFFKNRADKNGIGNGVLETNGSKGSSSEEVSEFGDMGGLNSKRGREQENGIEIGDLETTGPRVNDPKEVSKFGETGGLNNKRGRDIVPEPGSGKVMSLIKAFERLKTATPESKVVDQKNEGELGNDKKGVNMDLQIKAPETMVSSSSICPSDFLIRSQSLVSSSLDSNQGSFTFSSKGSCVGRRSRRNSIELSSTFGGRRWRRKQQQLKATRQQPFKLLTEQRGKNKEEEFTKKLQDMMIEEQKQRIPIAQGLPWTTDEPENLVKPPVKEVTRIVDLVLHSDVRAEERAEFDQQLAEKEALIEQYRFEKERQQKLAEEEEIRRRRKELIPKAQPMPYFDRPFIPRRSEKHPTIPREPKFHIPCEKKIKSCLSWNDFYVCQQ